MYVDRRALKRHKAYQNIAKSIREHSNNETQTTIRTGKSDFLLRTRPRGNKTPWSEIHPTVITQKIPEFEIGNYDDIVNPQNNPTDKLTEEQQLEQMEEMEDIMEDISRQNSLEKKTSNKRDGSLDDISQGKRKTTKPRTNSTTIGDNTEHEDSCEDSD